MKNKILIIGQAPPAVKQQYPYDTTLLYEMLSWVGITKERAQDVFEFEAISNKFPGFAEKGGHLKPSKADCLNHWNSTLEAKVISTDKIILLGLVARDWVLSMPKTWSCSTEIIALIHPSKRNYSKITENKEQIIKNLKSILL